MSYPGAGAVATYKALRAAGFQEVRDGSGNDLNVLRRAGFQGRARWSTWEDDVNAPAQQVWVPLWALQVVMWMTPEERPPARWAASAKVRGERLTVAALRALAHDREARASVQAVALTGRDQVVELLRRIAHLELLRREPREVWVGVCTSSVLGDGFMCRCTACSMDTTPDASTYNQQPHAAFEVRISELHPDDQELLDSGVPVVALDLFVGEEP